MVVRYLADADFAPCTDRAGPLEPRWVVWVSQRAAAWKPLVTDGFIHPAFAAGPPGKVQPSGAPTDHYNQSAPPAHFGCRAATGT